MKEIEKKKNITEIRYKCEVCNHEYRFKDHAIKCEKQHNCSHDHVEYVFLEVIRSTWWFNVKGIRCICKDCGTEIGEVDFIDIEDNQFVMKSIFQLILLQCIIRRTYANNPV